jgi:hypothetical protein
VGGAGESVAAGGFWALERVKDKDTRETFTDEECERLLRAGTCRTHSSTPA